MESSRMIEVRNTVRDLIELIVKEPGAVDVRVQRATPTVFMLEIHVAPEDVGRVIGQGGRTANSLRTIIAALSRDGVHCELVLPGSGRR